MLRRCPACAAPFSSTSPSSARSAGRNSGSRSCSACASAGAEEVVGPFDYDRYLVDQLFRPIANLYRVTPLARRRDARPGRRSPMCARRSSDQGADSLLREKGETQELFHIRRARGRHGRLEIRRRRRQQGNIGLLEHVFGKSALPLDVARLVAPRGRARNRARALAVMAIARRVIDFVPTSAGLSRSR